jgi:hypothetical protein
MRGENARMTSPRFGSFHANVVQRTINGKQEYAAIFSGVPVGSSWTLSANGGTIVVSIFGGQIAEIDLRLVSGTSG